ncbi:DNA cytosine methyltransferase [Paenibacillus sp. LS1]|uniref:DNA cytosine methyltransferase n=1 Tax=Paenibacillus sp. LS1 TaxID=2992120 RepID=UPI0022300FEE|nr:DNA cytosine methyltransferase [Paenibacillus sp. LS1]MCW3793748.1 DNA cytosine methyltransferase [Paenibacillus sp. LS1]
MPNIDGQLTVASFFSGAGLLDYSLMNELKIIWANEVTPAAAESYRANVGDHIHVGDINQIVSADIPYADIYVGCPPCQDYSSIGNNEGEEGERGSLIWTYFEHIKVNRPPVFLFENVIGLMRQHKVTFEKMLSMFKQSGYNVNWQILNACHYDTAQDRHRVFVVGVRKDLGFTFRFPGEILSISKTVYDAIGDLPPASGEIPNHLATWTSPSPERIKDVMMNPRKQFRGMRRLDWYRESPTLTAHIAKDGREFLHPSENRRLTVRECLRIMGTPDSYVFPDKVPLSHQYRAVGNGVAHNVGLALGKAIKEQLGQVTLQNSLF